MFIPSLTEALTALRMRVVRVQQTDEALLVDAVSSARAAPCPACSHLSFRQHGRYQRSLKAEPCLRVPISLRLEVRRFKCVNALCARVTFAERIDALAPPKHRRTVGLSVAWRSIGQALGGAAGARLSAQLGMPTSRDTLIRQVRRSAQRLEPPAPVVVGIDDWAITRGHRYGTIILDLERRRPIEVLDGRESTVVADWLQRHPSVQVVARDRAGAYSEAAQSAVPHALQVADRWHLLVNLREAVERLLIRRNARLREAAHLVAADGAPLTAEPQSHEPALKLTGWQKQGIHRRNARLARYEEVVQRRGLGQTYRAIARAMEIDRRTVRRLAMADRFPERAQRASGPVLLDPFRHHLAARVAEGCTSANTVWNELRAQGFKGCRATVRAAMARAHAVACASDAGQPVKHRASCPSAHRAYAWLIGWQDRGPREVKRVEHAKFIEVFCAIEPEIAKAASLAREFLGLVHRRHVHGFDRWLPRAATCEAPEIRRYAGSLKADLCAVRAAFQSPWSSGQVEGQINRLKFLKRQMYGRAKVDLLRARVLHPN